MYLVLVYLVYWLVYLKSAFEKGSPLSNSLRSIVCLFEKSTLLPEVTNILAIHFVQLFDDNDYTQPPATECTIYLWIHTSIVSAGKLISNQRSLLKITKSKHLNQHQGCIFRLTCSHPELTEDHVLTSAYAKIFRTVTRNAVNKSV